MDWPATRVANARHPLRGTLTMRLPNDDDGHEVTVMEESNAEILQAMAAERKKLKGRRAKQFLLFMLAALLMVPFVKAVLGGSNAAPPSQQPPTSASIYPAKPNPSAAFKPMLAGPKPMPAGPKPMPAGPKPMPAGPKPMPAGPKPVGPKDGAHALFIHGMMEFKAGKLAEAEKAFAKVLELDPHAEPARKKQKEVKEKREAAATAVGGVLYSGGAKPDGTAGSNLPTGR